ncbi:MAG TPA: hypothetical protein VEA99_15275 [Gemmatimonadaceae bacterium]|nr:hypothetical protein [Gemmatimonadaceae bacterium]
MLDFLANRLDLAPMVPELARLFALGIFVIVPLIVGAAAADAKLSRARGR